MGIRETDYRVIANVLETETSRNIVSYGLQGQAMENDEVEELTIRDVSTNYFFVEMLRKVLIQEGVALVHMRDVIEDALYKIEL